MRPRGISGRVCGNQNGYLKTKYHVFPWPGSSVFVPKPSQRMSTALSQDQGEKLTWKSFLNNLYKPWIKFTKPYCTYNNIPLYDWKTTVSWREIHFYLLSEKFTKIIIKDSLHLRFGNPSISCWDISPQTQNVNLVVVRKHIAGQMYQLETMNACVKFSATPLNVYWDTIL